MTWVVIMNGQTLGVWPSEALARQKAEAAKKLFGPEGITVRRFV